jgi:hypothetical protein
MHINRVQDSWFPTRHFSRVMRLTILVGVITVATSAGCQQPTTSAPANEWLTVTDGGVSVRAVRADSGLVSFVREAIRSGENLAITFFSAAPLQPFSISIYPDRISLTDRWRIAWQVPSFQAECWMIAAAWATELDLLSPRVWSRVRAATMRTTSRTSGTCWRTKSFTSFTDNSVSMRTSAAC